MNEWDNYVRVLSVNHPTNAWMTQQIKFKEPRVQCELKLFLFWGVCTKMLLRNK